MNTNLRTAALVAAGIVSAGSVGHAEEARMNPVETALTATTISGYVSASTFYNLGDRGERLPGRSFDAEDKLNKINLDVVKLSIEKPLDEGDWSAGYKVDLLFGADANTYGTSPSFPSGSSSSTTGTDFGIKQAYVTLQTPVGNDLIAKVGVFDTIIGYEVFESGSNPNYSRSYGYFIEPTQHTGLLLSYALTDWLSVNGGIANSYDAHINAPGVDSGANRRFGLQTYMGSLAITAPEGSGFLEGSTLYGGIVHGLTSTGDDDRPRTSYYAGLTVPTPVENLAVGAAVDYRTTKPAPGAEAWATAIGGYLTYQMSQQLKLGLRGEYAAGTAGTWTGTSAMKERFFGLTTTVDYSLWANVLTRLEFRWDNDLKGGSKNFGNTADPKDSAFVVGANVIYAF
ncbi:MAG: outer membrane beta-barrel protein [Verrucomicrobiae bacterium]|nr:outer membrane beta-barrel protein [Verrucomicrobiae bacterium]